MVADDLVQLNEVGSALLDPDGEALVQLRSGRFRQRVVGCVANQQVAEAKGILARELRPVRAQQLLSHEGRERSDELGLVRGERLHGAAVEHSPFDRATLEHDSLGGVELVEPSGEQCLDRRRHDDISARRFAHERDHFLDEERIPFGRLQDPGAQWLIGGCAPRGGLRREPRHRLQ